jgi:HlyD family secretion protein
MVMELKKWVLILLGLMTTIACSNGNGSDAFGQFEADEVIISAETNGRLISFSIDEGETVEAGTRVGTVDTTNLHLQKLELRASIEFVRSNISKLDAQKGVLQSQLGTAQKELNRLKALMQNNAATQQQFDTAEGRVTTLQKQIDAIEVDKQSVGTELNRIDAKMAQINNTIDRATIVNPIDGTVLNTFAEEYEFVAPGKPLYSIANLEEMILRVYISGAQLPQVRIGDQVQVVFDQDETTNQQVSGLVSWIASEAEFTPRMIQTKEERVTQVYAVKIRIENREGLMKIGMPGEVIFSTAADEINSN